MVLKSKPMVLAFKLWILFILTCVFAICMVKLFGPTLPVHKFENDPHIEHQVTF